jgi:hypothetical protein
MLEVGFPELVEYNNRATADEVVRIEVLDREDTVLMGFFDEEADPVWWLEGSYYPGAHYKNRPVRWLTNLFGCIWG